MIAQEPPALRPRHDEPPGKEQLRKMLVALEQLLGNLPLTSVDAPPGEVTDDFAGTFLRDWRELDSGHTYRERVRPPPLPPFLPAAPGARYCKSTPALAEQGHG